MASRTPQLGSVVWAEIADANGHRKSRPAVIVTPTTEVLAGNAVDSFQDSLRALNAKATSPLARR